MLELGQVPFLIKYTGPLNCVLEYRGRLSSDDEMYVIVSCQPYRIKSLDFQRLLIYGGF